MELILALAIGVLTGSGVWLLLRPRTFQVIMGLSLLSYAVNLFIFSMGRLGLAIDKEPVLQPGVPQDLAHYADPMPQALTLTAIVIGFAMTALFLVVLLASRGMAGWKLAAAPTTGPVVSLKASDGGSAGGGRL